MTGDCDRWTDTGPPAEVLRLLVAARQSSPPAGAVERTLGAVRLAAVPAGAAVGFSLLGSRVEQAPGWLKWGALGSGGALLLVGAIAARQHLPPYREPDRTYAIKRGIASARQRFDAFEWPARRGFASEVAPGAHLERQRAVVARVDALTEHPRQSADRSRGSRIAGVAAASTAVGVPIAGGLSDVEKQIALLARARIAVDAGKPRRALGLLDYCARSFERQDFTPEALLLRYRAWRLLGDFDAAARVARVLSIAHPRSPQARQVALLEEARVAP